MGVLAALSPRQRLLPTLTSWFAAPRRAVAEAGPEREDAFLLIKTVLATVLAWQFAVRALDSPTPYYAPLAALLTVDRTLVRSLWASAQRLIAVIVGMGIAWLIGSSVGLHWWSMSLVFLIALLIGRWPSFGDHGIQVPTMALLSLLTAGGTSGSFTYITIGETLAGGVIGVVINAIVIAPLHVDQSRKAVSRLTEQVRELLSEISRGLRMDWNEDTARAWHQQGDEIILSASDASAHVATGKESTRLNPRTNFREVQIDWAGYAESVAAVLRVQRHISGIAQSLVDAADPTGPQPWPSSTFISTYADALEDIALALSHFGRDEVGEQEAVKDHLDKASAVLDGLEERVRKTPLVNPRAWPAYGALLIDAKRIIRELAASHEVAAVPTDTSPVRRKMFERWRS